MALRSAPPGFNSTLVQLKDREGKKNQGCLKCFNSTLVQLKVSSRTRNLLVVFMFQFYLSSIKSC